MKSFPPFWLDEANQCLWRGPTRVSLMPKPFAVLRYLVEHSGRLVTQDELLGAIWPDTFVQPEVLRRYILEIRRALGDEAGAPRFVQTFPKRGYQFIAAVTDADAAEMFEAQPQPVSKPRLVGRTAALATLDHHLNTARRGQRQLIFVVGEPGIGKTSLVDAFCDRLGSPRAVFFARGQCAEGFGSKEPYYPVLEALGQLVRGDAGTAVVAVLSTHAPTWLVQFPSLVRAEQRDAFEREILGATRERMVRELCEALEEITRTRALVLVLEDLQWVDRSTLDVVAALARRREPAKLLVLGTFRPADLILNDSPLRTLKQDLLLHRLCDELPVEPLEESDVEEYLASGGASSDLPPGLARLIHRQSDGNPLFMTAMVDHLVQQGVLSQTHGSWTLGVPLAQVNPVVPDTLKQMLEIQLRHSSDTEQRILTCASVAGQYFTTWSITTMLVADTPPDLDRLCSALADRQQFIKWAGTRELPDGVLISEYQFRHALYREVLTRRLNAAERIVFHRRLAEGLERLRAPVEQETAAEIALHFEAGHEYERAVQHLLFAAQTATHRHAHEEAIAVLEHARDLAAKLTPDRQATLDLQILGKLGNAFYAFGNMERSAAVYDAMATHAAGAGLLASQAESLMRATHGAESIPFFLRAVAIDPSLASAYISLSRIYSNLGEADRARKYAKLAYERRHRLTGRELLSVTYQYHYEVSGNQALATQTLEDWKQAFPAEFQPVNGLTLIHNFLGRFDRAVEEGHEAVRRNPSHGYPYSNLAHAFRGLGRFDRARTTAEEAVARDIETLPTRRLLYQLAIIAGADDDAQRHVAWARDRPREFDMVGARAQVAGWSGRVEEARRLYEQAARMAERRNLADVGMSHLAWATWMELAYGNKKEALEQARRVLASTPSYDPALRAALALAAGGSDVEAETIAADFAASHPDHTFINGVLVPIVRAGVALARQDPALAIEHLRVVAPYELGFIAALAPVYLRAESYLMQGAPSLAAQEFERILAHRGSDPFSPFHAIAPLGLARAAALSGNATQSRAAYDQFLSAWANADPDIPVLGDARRACALLTDGA